MSRSEEEDPEDGHEESPKEDPEEVPEAKTEEDSKHDDDDDEEKEDEDETAKKMDVDDKPANVVEEAEETGNKQDDDKEENDKEEDDEEDTLKDDDDTVKDDEDDKENEDTEKAKEPENRSKKKDDHLSSIMAPLPIVPLDPELRKQQELIDSTPPTTELEKALFETLKRKEFQIERLTGEIMKLKGFISKRKQTYKRKRKDEGAPTRALSAYNIFVQDRFSKLAKENEQALKSSDTDAIMKRVPPASLVASTGNQWKELSNDEKLQYEERAREDRKRYEEQMAKYQPPDKQANRKRNKTGYNMFFSAHVLRLKQSESGVPSERGSVARLVGNAWKQLSAEEKQYYEREADKMNGMNPVDKDDDDEDGEDKRATMPEYPPNYAVQHAEMHMHGGMPPPMHGHPQQHDPRAQHAHYGYPPNYAYGQPPYHYHEQAAAAQGQHRHAAYAQRGAHPHYQYPPHPGYDQRGMGM